MQLVVKTKIKDHIDEAAGERMSVSTDFSDALNERVLLLVQQAIKRAKGNGRKTVMAKDI